ncbi:MAG: LON peptidase substrate-binding domain-containing protein [Ilumatobacteraceae bacterium]
MAVMRMFPLGLALLPGGVLPLHVFEPRYRQMIQDILADDAHDPEFGVTMIERGVEVGGGEARTTVGTVARILDMEVTPDGRYVVVAVGTERLRVNTWLPDDPYPMADVDPWPDTDQGESTVGADSIGALHERVNLLNEMVRELGEDAPPADTEISDDARLAVYQLGSLSPIGPVDRYRMLEAPGLSARIAVFGEALDDAAAVLEFRRT